MTVPASPAAPPEDVLDARSLAALRDLDPTGQGQLMQRIMSTFDATLARMHEQVADALAQADWTTLGNVAHTLKSSSGSIGALELARRCIEIEKLVRDGRQAGVQPLVAGWLGEMRRVRVAAQAFLDAPA